MFRNQRFLRQSCECRGPPAKWRNVPMSVDSTCGRLGSPPLSDWRLGDHVRTLNVPTKMCESPTFGAIQPQVSRDGAPVTMNDLQPKWCKLYAVFLILALSAAQPVYRDLVVKN